MKIIKYIFLFLFLIFNFQACSFKSSSSNYSTSTDKTFPNRLDYDYQLSENINYQKLYLSLNKQYNSWKAVPYKYGGNTKKGIDCSAFVQRTFKDRLNINIPRTTALQSQVGKNVSLDELEMGDLIFFKTGFNSRHVGIYLEGGKFLHASTKRGVTISRLDNNYYSKHFWKVKRIIY
ncbi:NlpC/P60 family protein [Arcobacter sp. LA11]|uniref:NlpC/P60 family protein n=1 Tax=Arcobacter sp. LA11 TaxID=1898176 RepID=UPI0009330FA0|nr:NlpC/P60 family protein [Arcobacter sp. LA11]